jgi:hypothetical protein
METTQQSDTNTNTLLSTSHPVLYSYEYFKYQMVADLTQKQLKDSMHECVHCQTPPENIPHGLGITLTLGAMICRNDYKLISEFIKNGDIDLNCCKRVCWLHFACKGGAYKIVEVMLKEIKLTTEQAVDMLFVSLLEEKSALEMYGITALKITRQPPISSNWDVLLRVANFKISTMILLFSSACLLGWTDAMEHIHKKFKDSLNRGGTLKYFLNVCQDGHIEALKLLIEMGYRIEKNKYHLCIFWCEKVDKIKEITSVLESHSDTKEQILGNEEDIVNDLWINIYRETAVPLFEYFVPIMKKSSLISLSKRIKNERNLDKFGQIIAKYIVY